MWTCWGCLLSIWFSFLFQFSYFACSDVMKSSICDNNNNEKITEAKKFYHQKCVVHGAFSSIIIQ